LKIRRISFAVLLPIAELALWSAMVLLPTVRAYARFSAVQKYGSVNIRAGEFELMVPRDRWLTIALADISEQRFHLVAGLNLPGAFIGEPLTVPAVSFLRSTRRVFRRKCGTLSPFRSFVSLPGGLLDEVWTF
jgi:hypothetical protein